MKKKRLLQDLARVEFFLFHSETGQRTMILQLKNTLREEFT